MQGLKAEVLTVKTGSVPGPAALSSHGGAWSSGDVVYMVGVSDQGCPRGQALKGRIQDITRWGHDSPLADPSTQALCHKGPVKSEEAGKVRGLEDAGGGTK